jgi:hypothetical protein
LLSVLPEILEPIRRHLGISNRVRDISMAHVVLKRPSIMPIVGVAQAEADGVLPLQVMFDNMRFYTREADKVLSDLAKTVSPSSVM